MAFHPQLFTHTHTRAECNNYSRLSAWPTEVCHESGFLFREQVPVAEIIECEEVHLAARV